jgi:hypothetical protein
MPNYVDSRRFGKVTMRLSLGLRRRGGPCRPAPSPIGCRAAWRLGVSHLGHHLERDFGNDFPFHFGV